MKTSTARSLAVAGPCLVSATRASQVIGHSSSKSCSVFATFPRAEAIRSPNPVRRAVVHHALAAALAVLACGLLSPAFARAADHPVASPDTIGSDTTFDHVTVTGRRRSAGARRLQMDSVRIVEIVVCSPDPASTSNGDGIVSGGIVRSHSDPSAGVHHVPAGPVVLADRPRIAALSLPDRSPALDVVNFRIDVPAAMQVKVQVFDVAGRLVRDLLHGGVQAGTYGVTWDTRDASGSRASPGIYLVRARWGSLQATRIIVVVR